MVPPIFVLLTNLDIKVFKASQRKAGNKSRHNIIKFDIILF